MKILNDITLFTCSFNNNLLTAMMIQSCFKQLGQEIPVVIMDNGTNIKCTDEMKSVWTVIDNTNFKITKDYHQISRNHCAAIDYALKNCINTKYVLLCDNDILFKPTVRNLIEKTLTDEVPCVGEIEKNTRMKNDYWRIFPFFCIINVEKMKADKINFFDAKRCMNEYDTKFNENGEWTGNIVKERHKEYGDTGSSFLWDIRAKNWKINAICMNEYITHLASASWNPRVKDRITNWLNANRDLII